MFQAYDIALGALTGLVVVTTLYLYMRKTLVDEKSSLDPLNFRRFKLIRKTEISHNTRLFRFGLRTPNSMLGLPVGKHLHLQAQIDGTAITRPYTPISTNDDTGYFDLLIKVYPQGKMSRYMDKLEIGDSILVKGPQGRFTYNGLGEYDMGPRGHSVASQIGMLAGGTGITPMYQVIRAILDNPNDTTQMSLIFGNVEERDILMREQLEQFKERSPFLKIYYTLDNAPDNWSYGKGYVNADMIKANMPPPGDSTLMLVCGPKPFVDSVIALLIWLGYSDKRIYKF